LIARGIIFAASRIKRLFASFIHTAFHFTACVYACCPLVLFALPLAGVRTTAGSASAMPVNDAANRIKQTNRREWDMMNFLLFLAILCSGSWFLLSNASELTNQARWANSVCSAAGLL
jgi:hypothetical protein